MLPADDIQAGLAGAWALMRGRPDGLKRLDLTANGFWNSFFAIPVALPALLLGWLGYIKTAYPAGTSAGAGTILRLAIVDLGAWILPLVVLALIARRTGLADRFVPYVVASNWGSVIAIWIMVPAVLFQAAAPGMDSFGTFLSQVLFIASIILTWRLTNATIGKGAAVGTAVFAGMFVASLAVLALLQELLGLSAAG